MMTAIPVLVEYEPLQAQTTTPPETIHVRLIPESDYERAFGVDGNEFDFAACACDRSRDWLNTVTPHSYEKLRAAANELNTTGFLAYRRLRKTASNAAALNTLEQFSSQPPEFKKAILESPDRLFRVRICVRPKPAHQLYYEMQFGFLNVFVHADNKDEAAKQARSIVGLLPYEMAISGDLVFKHNGSLLLPDVPNWYRVAATQSKIVGVAFYFEMVATGVAEPADVRFGPPENQSPE